MLTAERKETQTNLKNMILNRNWETHTHTSEQPAEKTTHTLNTHTAALDPLTGGESQWPHSRVKGEAAGGTEVKIKQTIKVSTTARHSKHQGSALSQIQIFTKVYHIREQLVPSLNSYLTAKIKLWPNIFISVWAKVWKFKQKDKVAKDFQTLWSNSGVNGQKNSEVMCREAGLQFKVRELKLLHWGRVDSLLKDNYESHFKLSSKLHS